MKKLPRTFKIRRTALLITAALIVFAVLVLFFPANATPTNAQAPTKITSTNPPTYEFDVATFKPSQNTDQQFFVGGIRFSDNGARSRNAQLRQLIQWSYGLVGRLDDVVSGGPKWLDTDRYDITAKMDTSVADQLNKLRSDERELAQEQMVRALLADRLKLRIHRETRVFPVYALTIAKGGSKLHQAKPGDTYDKATFAYADKFADSDAKAGQLFVVGGRGPDGHPTMTFYAFGVSMPALARKLNVFVGMIVQDKTGLTGKYDFTLKFTLVPTGGPSATIPEEQPVPAASDPTSGLTIFAAIQQQLGLKLESTKGPVEIVVIDHVERPSGN